MTDLSGHSSIATAPYPATSPATFSSSAAGPGPHPHSYLPASWHQNPYHRPTSAASYPGAGPHDAVAGLYDTGTTTMASRFIDERNSGIAPSSINRAAPPPLSSAAAADFIQRPHPAAAAADGLSLPRPGPVQKKRGKLPEEGRWAQFGWLAGWLACGAKQRIRSDSSLLCVLSHSSHESLALCQHASVSLRGPGIQLPFRNCGVPLIWPLLHSRTQPLSL